MALGQAAVLSRSSFTTTMVEEYCYESCVIGVLARQTDIWIDWSQLQWGLGLYSSRARHMTNILRFWGGGRRMSKALDRLTGSSDDTESLYSKLSLRRDVSETSRPTLMSMTTPHITHMLDTLRNTIQNLALNTFLIFTSFMTLFSLVI